MKLLLVRHGETTDNVSRICQGQTPGQLTSKGQSQALLLASTLVKTPISLCYTSDLRRAVETCDIIMTYHPEARVRQDKRLRERDFGDFQGRQMPSDWDGLAPFCGAEPMDALYKRASSFVSDMQAIAQGETVLIISHGITLKILTAVCLGYSLSQIDSLQLMANCSISRLNREKADIFSVESYNDTSHLPGI